MKKHRTKWYLAIAATLLGGCYEDSWAPETLRDGPAMETTKVTPAMLEQGRRSYVTYCSGCHGLNGDGNGPSAHFMDPKPRDFRVGIIKFAQVEGGKRPRDADYLKVISRGLKGTAMPSFRLLPLDERKAIVAYIRTFPDEAIQKKPPGELVAIPRDPFRKKPEKGVRLGERVYHGFASCQSCHPA
ncbi:MAG TPA: cytochrome c, partial [Sorangium sp.]|nr:cytochrome c [Sorangium sp.]